MDSKAELVIADSRDDFNLIAARRTVLWVGLAVDDGTHGALRRDGIDLATLRLTGLHPSEFARSADGGLQVVADANDDETTAALLDLFRIYFLRRQLRQ